MLESQLTKAHKAGARGKLNMALRHHHLLPGDMINTTLGPMKRSELVKKWGGVDNDDEISIWVEFYHDDDLVHRSAHVHLKKNVINESAAASF